MAGGGVCVVSAMGVAVADAGRTVRVDRRVRLSILSLLS